MGYIVDFLYTQPIHIRLYLMIVPILRLGLELLPIDSVSHFKSPFDNQSQYFVKLNKSFFITSYLKASCKGQAWTESQC